MKRVYVTLTNRVEKEGASPEDRSEAYVLDWESKTVLDALDVYGSRDIEIGRSRGASGITWYNDKLYVASRSGISIFNPNTYDKEGYLELGHANGIHQIKSYDGYLWIVNTGDDSILKVSGNQVVETIELRDLGDTVTGLLRGDHRERNWGENKLHVNSIAWTPEGDMLLLFMAAGCIYNYTRQEVIAYAHHWRLSHDLCILNSSNLLISSSNKAMLDVVNYAEGDILWGVFNSPIHPYEVGGNSLGFLRGVALNARASRVFVTATPGTLLELRTDTWEVLDTMIFSENSSGSPYDILLDPRDWSGHEMPV